MFDIDLAHSKYQSTSSTIYRRSHFYWKSWNMFGLARNKKLCSILRYCINLQNIMYIVISFKRYYLWSILYTNLTLRKICFDFFAFPQFIIYVLRKNIYISAPLHSERIFSSTNLIITYMLAQCTNNTRRSE